MRLNVWNAYRLGLRTKTGNTGSAADAAMFAMRNLRRPARVSWLFTPIDFLRYREFDFALRTISQLRRPPQRVLDLSSPKLLPLTLADSFPTAHVHSTDVLDREIEWVAGKARTLGLSNLHTQRQDARRLDLPSDSFDLVTSISVFEHIAPEIDGDKPAIAELARVLAPGGTAIVTVPCSRRYFADFVQGDVYERCGHGQPIFFQRFYTPEMLRDRFGGDSGLEIASLRYVEEQYFFKDPRKRVAHWINCSPLQNRVFGPMFPLLSHLFLSPPRPLEKCRKPYIACLVLRKPIVARTAQVVPQAIAA